MKWVYSKTYTYRGNTSKQLERHAVCTYTEGHPKRFLMNLRGDDQLNSVIDFLQRYFSGVTIRTKDEIKRQMKKLTVSNSSIFLHSIHSFC